MNKLCSRIACGRLAARGRKEIKLPVTPDKKFDILLTAYQIGDDLLQTPLDLNSVFNFSMTEEADRKCIHTAPRFNIDLKKIPK